MQSAAGGEGEESDKEGASAEPNYALSGKLTADTNTFRVKSPVKINVLCGYIHVHVYIYTRHCMILCDSSLVPRPSQLFNVTLS